MLLTDEYIRKAEKKVDKGNPDECWNWLGRKNQVGVGIFVIEKYNRTKHRKVETYQAHILMYKHFTGTNPDARYYDRMCENLLCCNPNHIVPRDLEARLLKNLKYVGDCWIKTTNLHNNGYSMMFYEGDSDFSHRISYRHFKGKIPEGMQVLHSCHNRACINPDHLRLGTHRDNMRDMTNANRQAVGEDNGNSVLTENDVREIRQLGDSGNYAHKEIARMFGVGRPTITDIIRKKTWRWLDE